MTQTLRGADILPTLCYAICGTGTGYAASMFCYREAMSGTDRGYAARGLVNFHPYYFRISAINQVLRYPLRPSYAIPGTDIQHALSSSEPVLPRRFAIALRVRCALCRTDRAYLPQAVQY
eukprot:3193234-Rhodomonas_salina.2